MFSFLSHLYEFEEYFNLFYLKVQFNVYDVEQNAQKLHVFASLFIEDDFSQVIFSIT